MNERVTIRDVAKEANVSIATVSKALNGVDVVRPLTKEKVFQAAKKLHYAPNLLGKQLKTKRTKMIGFYTHTIVGPYFSSLIEAIAEETEPRGYGVSVIISSDKQVLRSHLLGNMVDGFIGFESLIDDEDLAIIRGEHIKAVFMDRQIKDYSISSMVFDSRNAGRLATEFLIAKGHKKIGFLPGHPGVYDSDERYRGFQELMAEHHLAVNPDWVISGLFEEQESYRNVLKYLQTTPKKFWPSALIAGNDLSAIGTIHAAQEVGLRVPEDLSVIGFDDIDLLRYFEPKITTVQNPIKEQGRQAVIELLQLIDGVKEGENHILPGELVIRETVGNYEK